MPEEGAKLPITLSAAVTDIKNQLSMWKEEAQRHKQLLQEHLDKVSWLLVQSAVQCVLGRCQWFVFGPT